MRTDRRVRGWAPTVVDMKPCEIYSQGSTQWCEYTDEQIPHWTQTTTTTTIATTTTTTILHSTQLELNHSANQSTQTAQTLPRLKFQPNVIQDSKLDLDVYWITPKMLCLVGVSHFATFCKNLPVTVWEMPYNALLCDSEKMESDPQSTRASGSPPNVSQSPCACLPWLADVRFHIRELSYSEWQTDRQNERSHHSASILAVDNRINYDVPTNLMCMSRPFVTFDRIRQTNSDCVLLSIKTESYYSMSNRIVIKIS